MDNSLFSDIVILCMISFLILYSLRTLGLIFIIMAFLIFTFVPTFTENTENACQAVDVLRYHHIHGPNKLIPPDDWLALMSDGTTYMKQAGDGPCIIEYWKIIITSKE